MMLNNSPISDEACTILGTRLVSDVYYPSEIRSGQTFPVLLMRQPYGRSIASTVVYAHPSWYAAQGYIVVIQDVRGRGDSEGEFVLFESERSDGYESVLWAANLPHSNGLVGMYGFSYQGMTQLYAAADRPEPLKTICPAMMAYDLREDWAYENNVFCLQGNVGWALQLVAETARRSGDVQKFQALKLAASNLPLNDETPAYPEIFKTLATDSFYHDWILRSSDDDYWQRLSPRSFIDQIADIPMLHIGGWFDPYLRGTLRLYEAMKTRSKAPQSLIIGPWAHLPWGRKAGEVDYGPMAVSDCDRAQIQWFDYWLKGEGSLNASATWFEMGSNQWVTKSKWSVGENRSQWHLLTTGFTSIRGSELCAERPEHQIPDVLVHDPWRPVPSIGGHASFPAGPIDRSAVDDRSDVLTYSSEPIQQSILIQGSPTVDLEFESTAKSIDLHIVLSQITEMGNVLPIVQGVCSVNPQKTTTAQIILQSTSILIPVSSALRVSVSLACFPAFPVNPGTGISVAEARAIEAQVITLYLKNGTLRLPTEAIDRS